MASANVYRDLRRALEGPAALLKECVGTPDPWQSKLMEANPRRALLACGRQVGKSTALAAVSLWELLFGGNEAALILLVSPSLRQSQELMRKVLDFYRQLEGIDDPEALSSLKLETRSGARIIALPGSSSTVRGYSAVTSIYVDEAAHIDRADNEEGDSILNAVRPALATTNGRLWMVSSPFGRRGQFYKAWNEGGDEWHRVKVPTSECPRVTKEWLEQEEAEMGPMRFKGEYEAEFTDSDAPLFTSDLIEGALSEEVAPLWN
jgi:Terminase large subunit, T4likevirus-type, N-terminal